MKVLYIIETLGNGGAERVLVNTLPALQKLGLDCEVAILFQRDDLAFELESRGIIVHRLNLSHKWSVLEGILKVYFLAKKGKYDIIHAHLFFAYFYAGLVKLFCPEMKIFTTFHNLGYDTYPADTVIKKLRKMLDSFVVNRLIDKKVAVSHAVKEHYAKHLKIPKIDVIFNAFPLDSIKTALTVEKHEVLKKYADVAQYDIFSITPGRLVKEKGHAYLLKAFEKLNKKRTNLCHFIVGSGPLQDEIVDQIAAKGLSNVILIPGLPQQDLFDLISVCHFVVIPSISEGFGMVVGEAMILGKAVLATQVNGIIDIVDNDVNGLLVSPKDSDALCEAIERLCLDPELRSRLEENGKEKIINFDIQMIAEQWKLYYNNELHG